MVVVPGGRIQLVSLTKRFAEVAVDDITLDIASGEFFSLLGPSGCGKTTTLRLIAGFEQPTAGRIMLDGVDLSAVPPHKRNVNTVFQSYALFPFLTVYDNVAFGLRNKKLPKAEVVSQVSSALELVKLRSFEKRRPGQLSGGQQQRVALARALVLQPSVLLLDEPLGALDAKLRRSLKVELKALQEEVGITFLYVTHDQEEALTMSDRLAVMREGKIVQIGQPADIYQEPADTYVADFLGVSNLMPVDVVSRGPGSACQVRLGESILTVEQGGQQSPDHSHAVIRPERVKIEDYSSTGPNRVPAMVERLVYMGSSTQVYLRLAAGCDVQVLLPNDGSSREHLAQGTPVQAYLPPDALRVLAGGTPAADEAAASAQAHVLQPS